MLQLYDLDKVKIKGLKNYKDYSIESDLSNGDKSLSFLYPVKESTEIVEEWYIRTKKEEFVIKEIQDKGEWKSIKATLNVEDIEGHIFEHFDTTEKTIKECITLALVGTGWTIGTCNVTRRRTVRKTNSSSWEIIQEAKKVYRAEFELDTLNKKINIFEKLGNDKGVYFIDSLNLKTLDIQSNSYDFYTRIIAIGKNDIRVTLENFQYSKKVKTFLWKDEKYTDKNSLREDALAKLNELSKPRKAYSASIVDLANMNLKYKNILSYSLGDTISLISKDKEIKEKQRIVKIVEYPQEPEKNTCEIANATLKFEDLQKEFQETSNTVDNITTDNGTVDGNAVNGISSKKIYDFEANVGKIVNLDAVNARIENLYVEKADVGSLNAAIINAGQLIATKATITDLEAINVSIVNLKADKANITDLNAINIKVNVLEVNTGNIKTLLAGNLTSGNIQSLNLTSDKVTVANGFIKNAMIETLDVSKINAGDISTTKFRITSASGNMLIADNTIQIKDVTRVRVQIGKDASNDYNMYVWDATGKLMFDATGLKEDGIKNKIIRDDMVSDTANISGSKLNIASVVTSINNGATTIKSSKVNLDGLNQTLEVAFNGLKSQADGTKSLTESHTTSIGVQQGKIDTLISDTSIITNGVTTKLKDEYNKTISTVNSINTTIGKHQSTLDTNTGEIASVTADVANVKIDLTGITQRVGSSETKITNVTTEVGKVAKSLEDANVYTTAQITTVNNSVSTANSEISQLKKSIVLKVEQTNVDTAKSQAITESVGTKDTRSTNQNPQWYFTNYPKRTVNEFKFANIIGIPGAGSVYGTCITAVPWDSSSGGYPVQTFTSYGTSTFERSGISNTAWSAWKQIEDIAGSQAKANAAQTNAVTITETKINQANADIKIETDSIKQSVSSVNSEIITTTTTANNALSNASTAQIQANLGVANAKGALDKANLVDGKVTTLSNTVTNTNTKVVSIETNLTGITSRVSAEEKKSTSIDNKVIAQDTRLKIAEQKITDSSIISTVQATINSAKTDAINSANATTTGKFNAYSTTSQMTSAITQSAAVIKQEVSNTYITTGNANNIFATKSSVVQTDKEWRATFKSGGGSNILVNGLPIAGKRGIDYWATSLGPNNTGDIHATSGGGENWDGEKYRGGLWWTGDNKASSWCCLFQNSLNNYKFSVSKKYSISLIIYNGKVDKNMLINIIDPNGLNSVFSSPNVNIHNGYQKISFDFTPQQAGNIPGVGLYLDTLGPYEFYIPWIVVKEGGGTDVWIANANEIQNGATTIDADGITIYNGAIKVLDGAGNEVLKGDSSGISFSGRLQPRDNTIRLFGENCKLEGGYGGLRRSVGNTYDSVTDGGAWVLFNPNSQNGTRYAGITVDRESHVQLFSQSTMLKLLNGGTPSVQARWAGDGGYCMMQASSFTVSSREEFKENIQAPDNIDFQKILMENTIKSYNYKQDMAQIEKISTVMLPDGTNPIKADIKIGLVIEELSEEAVSLFNPTGSDGVDLYSMCSVLWKVNQEQEERIAKLERLFNV